MIVAQLRVDFNDVYDDDYIRVAFRRTAGIYTDALQVGEWVELRDDDDASCWAIVREVRQRSVVCKLDWSQWRSVTTMLVREMLPHGVTADPILTRG